MCNCIQGLIQYFLFGGIGYSEKSSFNLNIILQYNY